MHVKFNEADRISFDTIGAAIELHKALGPGLLESIYERCLVHELSLRGHKVENQKSVNIQYKGISFEESLRFDVLVSEILLIEVKAVDEVAPVHKAQLLSYMKILSIPIGLLINFHEPVLKRGIHRLILSQ